VEERAGGGRGGGGEDEEEEEEEVWKEEEEEEEEDEEEEEAEEEASTRGQPRVNVHRLTAKLRSLARITSWSVRSMCRASCQGRTLTRAHSLQSHAHSFLPVVVPVGTGNCLLLTPAPHPED